MIRTFTVIIEKYQLRGSVPAQLRGNIGDRRGAYRVLVGET
jgi:hypothetical protein